MCNKNVIKSRALDKLDELLKEALSNYKETKDIQSLCDTIPTGYFSDEEYKEVMSNKENIYSSPDIFAKIGAREFCADLRRAWEDLKMLSDYKKHINETFIHDVTGTSSGSTLSQL